AVYHETLNGVQFGHRHNNFRAVVDPYLIPHDPTSGLLPGISTDAGGAPGEGDGRVQAYNFRVCLTSSPENRLPQTLPLDYDARRYALLARYFKAGGRDTLELIRNIPNGE